MKKKLIAAVSVLAIASAMAGCTSGGTLNSEIAGADQWIQYDSLEEAQEAAGFEISLPDMSDHLEEEVYRVSTALAEIEVKYSDSDSRSTYIRKAKDDGDISGIYDKAGYEEEAAVGEVNVTFKGDDADSVYLAVWNAGNYAYCISLEEPVDFDTMSALVSEVE